MKKLVLIVISLTLFLACVKKKLPDNEALLGLDYYPLTQGKFIIYDIDSTRYEPIGQIKIKNTKYRIKEKIADSYTDNEGKPAIRIERYIKMLPLAPKTYDSIPWTIKEVWMMNATKYNIQVSERDVRYTKLIFPIQENVSWNGNAKNTIGEWNYTYAYIDKKETIGGTSMDKVLQIKQFNLPTLISYQNYSEKYAKGIGLVYREISDYTSNTITYVNGVAVPIENRIEFGVIYKQTFLSYGYE